MDGDIPQQLAEPSLDHKHKRGAKKSLTLVAIIQAEPKENATFSKDEDEKHTCISSEGKFETDSTK
jgi:hypothetical protein